MSSSECLTSQTALAEKGGRLLDTTLTAWLRGVLPALPEEGVQVRLHGYIIDKIVDRLRNKVEPFAVVFGLAVLLLPTPDPAHRPGITPPPYRQHDHLRTGMVQFSTKTCCPPFPP